MKSSRPAESPRPPERSAHRSLFVPGFRHELSRHACRVLFAALPPALALLFIGRAGPAGVKNRRRPLPGAPTINLPIAARRAARHRPSELAITGTNLARATGATLGFPAKIKIPPRTKWPGQLQTESHPRGAGRHAARPLPPPRGDQSRHLEPAAVRHRRPAAGDSKTARTTRRQRPAGAGAVRGRRPDGGRAGGLLQDRRQGRASGCSFDVLGRRLGSPDRSATVALRRPRAEREIAYDNDSPGLPEGPAPQLHLQGGRRVPGRGQGRAQPRRGGLRLSPAHRRLPARHRPDPDGREARDARSKVEFAGPARRGGVQPVDVAVPADPAAQVVWVAPRGPGGLQRLAGARCASRDVDEVVEQEPNNEPAKANALPVPGGVTGRFQQSR